LQGRLGCFSKDNHCFASFPKDSFIGEIEAMRNTPRKFAVKALEGSRLLAIPFDKIVEILGARTSYMEQLYSLSLRRHLRLKLANRRIRRFRHLSAKDLFWETADNLEIREPPFNEQVERYLACKLLARPGAERSTPLEEYS
jgi:CRP-like cAMP-binding protein